MSVLKGATNPAIAQIRVDYEPVWNDFNQKSTKRFSATAVKSGDVLALQQSLRALSQTHIKEWALAIETVHRRHTAAYKVLLPDGRKPFRSGKAGLRIQAVTQLAIALADEPALALLHATVLQEEAALKALDAAAGAAKSTAALDSGEVERARIALCTALYVALLRLMALSPEQPARARAYFDVGTMHRRFHRKRKAGGAEEAGENNDGNTPEA